MTNETDSNQNLKSEILAVIHGEYKPLPVSREQSCGEMDDGNADELYGDEWKVRKAEIWAWLRTQKDLALAIAAVEPVKGWWEGRYLEPHEVSSFLRRSGITTHFKPSEILRAFREGGPPFSIKP